jgi:hypothetical protein
MPLLELISCWLYHLGEKLSIFLVTADISFYLDRSTNWKINLQLTNIGRSIFVSTYQIPAHNPGLLFWSRFVSLALRITRLNAWSSKPRANQQDSVFKITPIRIQNVAIDWRLVYRIRNFKEHSHTTSNKVFEAVKKGDRRATERHWLSSRRANRRWTYES